MAIEEQNNRDLRATLALSQEEARKGTTRTLTLSGGRFVSVMIPAGAYEGQEIRLEGQGQAVGEQPPGALILTIAIASPESVSPPVLHEDANSATLLTHLPPPPPPQAAQSSYPGTTAANSYPYSYYPSQGESQYYQQNYVQYGQQAPYIAGAPPRTRPRSPALMIVLITLIILVLGVSIPIYYVTIFTPQQIAAHATATAAAKITGTAAANATGTAQVVGTVQAQASATATVISGHQANYNQITGNTPVLNDPLQNGTLYNWDTGTGCAFNNGEYHVTIAQKNVFLYCSAESTNFSNFLYQVQMKIVTGDFGGIIFRADTTNTKFYLFRIGQDGSYDLYYYPDKEGAHAKNLASGNSALILTGANQNNLIAAVANNGTIDLYINKKYLTSVNDSSLSSGKIGVIAQGGANPGDVAYTQAQVWKL